MSNAKSRYYEAVSISDETPNKFSMYTWLDSSTHSTCHLPYDPDVEHNFGRFDSWLRPLPPDAVVISGAELTLMKAVVAQLRPRPSSDNYDDLEDARFNILSILNRSQQNEEK